MIKDKYYWLGRFQGILNVTRQRGDIPQEVRDNFKRILDEYREWAEEVYE